MNKRLYFIENGKIKEAIEVEELKCEDGVVWFDSNNFKWLTGSCYVTAGNITELAAIVAVKHFIETNEIQRNSALISFDVTTNEFNVRYKTDAGIERSVNQSRVEFA